MSNFLYPPKFLVYQMDNDGHQWVPALFDHRERQYFVVGETLDELVTLVQDGTVTGDSDPITDLRVVNVESGELYVLIGDRTAFLAIDRDWGLFGPDKSWFDFH